MRIRAALVIALAGTLLWVATAVGAVERHWLAPVAITPPGQVVGLPALAVDGPGAAVPTWTQPALVEAVVAARLVALHVRSGSPVGRAVDLGSSATQTRSLAVTAGDLWILRPSEGALHPHFAGAAGTPLTLTLSPPAPSGPASPAGRRAPAPGPGSRARRRRRPAR